MASSTFEKYPAYKDTGLEYLMELPEHWSIQRLASFGRFSKGGGFSKADLSNEGVRSILYGDIYTSYEFKVFEALRFIPKEVASYGVPLEKGDLLFTGSGETKEDIGRCVVFLDDEHTVAGGDIIIFRQKNHNNLYLCYLLNSETIKYEKARHAKGEIIVHTYASKLKNLFVTIPPLPEQAAIAAFLDDKTAKIDRAIAQKQKLIELLKERKQIVIQELVTGKKVWNNEEQAWTKPAKTKDSGVEWIGEIPEGWEVKKIKHIAKIIDCKHLTPNYVDEGIPVVSTGNIKPERITLDTARFVSEEDFLRLTEGDRTPIKGDIIYSRNASVGSAALVRDEFKFCLGQDVCLVRAKINPRFLEILLNSGIVMRQLERELQGSTFSRINIQQIKEYHLFLPDERTSDHLAKVITELNELFDQSISLQQAQIEKFNEYKAVLVDNVVTGKIKVV